MLVSPGQDYVKAKEALVGLLMRGGANAGPDAGSLAYKSQSLTELVKLVEGLVARSHPQPVAALESSSPDQGNLRGSVQHQPDPVVVLPEDASSTDLVAPSAARDTSPLALPDWQRALQTTPVLIISFDRADYLDRTLAALLKHHPGGSLAPIVISEDGRHGNMAKMVEKYRQAFRDRHPNVAFVHLHHTPNLNAENNYFKLAEHYKWALRQVRQSPEAMPPDLQACHVWNGTLRVKAMSSLSGGVLTKACVLTTPPAP